MLIPRRRFLPLAALTGVAFAHAQAGRTPLRITRFVIHKATLRWRDLIFLEVQTNSGLVGLGEATLEGRSELVEAALNWLEEDFVGRDPSGPEEHWDRAYYRLSRWRSGAAIMSAISAIDIALWDLEGKRLGVPVWQLLGGSLRPKFRVYYTHWCHTRIRPLCPAISGLGSRDESQRLNGGEMDCVLQRFGNPANLADRVRNGSGS